MAAGVGVMLVILAVGLGFALLVVLRHTDFGSYGGGLESGRPEDLLASPAFWIGRGVSALFFAGAGWYLVRRRPRVVLGPVVLAAGVGNALALAGAQWVTLSTFGGHPVPGTSFGLWFVAWGLAVEPVALAAIFVLFPDGSWPTGLLGWVARLGVVLCCAGLLHSFVEPFAADPLGPLASIRHPLGVGLLPGLDDVVLIFPGLLISNAVLVIRWLKARGELRLVLRSLAVVTLVLSLPMLFAPAGAVGYLSTAVVLVVVIGGVLRHRVYGIEVVLNRTLVYAALTVIVAVVYAALVGLVNVVGNASGIAEGLVPAMGAAFSLLPARQRVQRAVNRFLYGARDEPYAVVSRVGSRVEAAGSGEQLLPAVLESLVEVLRLPYAAVDLHGAAGAMRHVEYGIPTVDVERFPLVHHGTALGDLVVGRRAGEKVFAPGERRLLEDIARQVAVAASNVMLTEELMRSRERVVNAAEEERRRLRRDLHDGLGPVLTAAAAKVDASRNLLRRDAERVDELLCQVRADLTSALDDLRRLVYALRPPALDQLGLLGALREHVRRSAVPVVLDLPRVLPDLPPALEVTAYRIVTEALTNVARHARASSCTVSVSCSGTLRIQVYDDGPGNGPWTPGVGLSSMRERTAELGGSWTAGPDPNGGGRVLVELPLGDDRKHAEP